MEIIFLYVLPILLKTSYFNLFTYKPIIALQIIILSIFVNYVLYLVFVKPNKNGFDLVIASKPINKHFCIWTKFLVSLFILLMLSVLACILALFSMFTLANTKTEMTKTIILSEFVGTFLTGLISLSFGILLCSIWNTWGSIILNVGIQFVLFLLFIVSSLTVNTGLAEMKKEGHKINDSSLITFQNNKPKQEFVYLNNPRIFSWNFFNKSDDIQQIYNKANQRSNWNTWQVFDLENQYINLFKIFDDNVYSKYSYHGYVSKMNKNPKQFTHYRIEFVNKYHDFLVKNSIQFRNKDYFIVMNPRYRKEIDQFFKSTGFTKKQIDTFYQKYLINANLEDLKTTWNKQNYLKFWYLTDYCYFWLIKNNNKPIPNNLKRLINYQIHNSNFVMKKSKSTKVDLPIEFVDTNYLKSISIMKFSNEYNLIELTIFWTTFSIICSLVAIKIFSVKDVY